MKNYCTVDGCEQPVNAGGLCKLHGEYLARGEALGHRGKVRSGKNKHVLSDVNREELTATCKHCGEVKVVYRPAKNTYECATGKALAQRDYFLRRKYGITLDDLIFLWDNQDRCCKICRKPISHSESHVDHDHATGAVRGLLCGQCNRGLGMFYDSVEFLERAAEYLRSDSSSIWDIAIKSQ